MSKEFHRLISLEEALAAVLAHRPRPSAATVPLTEALGRVLAVPAISQIEVPGFDRAAMDGYAVRALDTVEAREDRPIRVRLVGAVGMGQSPDVEVAAGCAAEISTGGMMPKGADAVVMVEYAHELGDCVLVSRPAFSGENTISAGSDIGLFEPVLRAHTVLGPREIGVLAALGIEQVPVLNLDVAVASSGNELLSPGSPLEPARVYDINSYTVAASLRELGAAPRHLGIIPDQKDLFVKELRQAADNSDMVIVSGSTSAGRGDVLYEAIAELGQLLFHGINLKPGKPTVFGLIGETPVLGLPGYPTSALTVFRLLAAPAVMAALGQSKSSTVLRGRLGRPLRSESRRQMLAVALSRGTVHPVDKGSGSITTLARADGFLDIPPSREYLAEGEEVEVHMLAAAQEPDLVLAGESCPALDRAADSMPGLRLLSEGSRQGLKLVRQGVADVASVTSALPGLDTSGLVPLLAYQRDLGLIFRDRPEGRFVGWPKGSAMADLQEGVFWRLALTGSRQGTARSHGAAAAWVASGRADLAFGSRAAAGGLQFRAETGDRIELLSRSDRLGRACDLIAFLRSLRLPGVAVEPQMPE
ncbi:MAG TPA: molybdopterin-binding protein [Methanotrichaceae archaeon]|nr:molybdopterin-binding protein [Methanotrichaceae archaeon]HQF17371.1 molybdopterin-binding protein [Methanotrichaceae archaeon]HQI91988.1 molybdopterin-binding protein [Methanotrichaceae archaeon]